MNVNLGKLREMVMDREACNPWGHEGSDMTWQMNNKNMY